MAEFARHRCDVLVIGGGPAGIAAAARAAECGKKVFLIDDNLQLGGQIWRAARDDKGTSREHDAQASAWIARLQVSKAELLLGWRVVFSPSAKTVVAESDGGSCEIGFEAVVLATGARELLLPFPGWTLRNVMGAGALQAMVKAGLSVTGKRVVVAGSGPLLLAVGAFLQRKGAVVLGIYEQTSWRSLLGFSRQLIGRPKLALQGLGYRRQLWRTPFAAGWWPVAVRGADQVRSLVVTNGARQKDIACDYVACGFHLLPNLELPRLFGCQTLGGSVVVDDLQQTSVSGIFSAGETAGVGGLELALVEGEIAGLACAGQSTQVSDLLRRKRSLRGYARRMAAAFALRPELKQLPSAEETIVCRCEDVRWGSVRTQGSLRAAKLHTRCGMGACQGRICGAALHYLLSWDGESIRPPVYPVRLSTLVSAAEQQ